MSGRTYRHLERIGTVGVVLTLTVGVIGSSPAVERRAVALLEWLSTVIFPVSAVSIFCIGLVVIFYSNRLQKRGEASEEARRLIAFGVGAVYVLSLGLTVVIVDDLAWVVMTLAGLVDVNVSRNAIFATCLCLFGGMVLVGLLDRLTRRRSHRGA